MADNIFDDLLGKFNDVAEKATGVDIKGFFQKLAGVEPEVLRRDDIQAAAAPVEAPVVEPLTQKAPDLQQVLAAAGFERIDSPIASITHIDRVDLRQFAPGNARGEVQPQQGQIRGGAGSGPVFS